MRISTRGRYGARAMLDLAERYQKGPISLKDLAQGQEISPKYLEQLLVPLRSTGIINSVRGARGGYMLAKDPAQVTLAEIVIVVEGSLAPVHCVDDPAGCHRYHNCVTHQVWCEIGRAVNDILSEITLADLVKKQKERGQTHPQAAA